MRIDPDETRSRDLYQAMITLIVPRPIAWVSTLSTDGVVNLAPFSFFTGITSDPPTICVCVGVKRSGEPKDTARNVLDTGELVVNVVPSTLAAPMVQTSGDYPAGESELDAIGLETLPSERVRPPRVAGTPAQLECTLHDHLEIRNDAGKLRNLMLIGRIRMIHVDDAVLGEDGLADPVKLDPLGRLGRQGYAKLGELLDIPRPKL